MGAGDRKMSRAPWERESRGSRGLPGGGGGVSFSKDHLSTHYLGEQGHGLCRGVRLCRDTEVRGGVLGG